MRSRHDLTQKPFCFLWITDPWKTLDHPQDTSLRLMEESQLLGFENYWCDVRSIGLDSLNNGITLVAKKLIRTNTAVEGHPDFLRSTQSFQFEPEYFYAPSFFNSIQYRTDPPIDQAYIHPLQLLSLGIQNFKHTQIVNPPSILLLENEKFSALHFKGLIPASVVSSQLQTLLAFGKLEGKVVLKPLHQAQSKGIELLNFQSQRNIQSSITSLNRLTRHFTQPVLLQKYLPAIHQGEERLWFIDGKLLAHIKKVPKQGQFRIDMDHGGFLLPSKLSLKAKKAIPVIAKGLKKLGIRLAAIDFIDGYITDFNFTSPGLLPQMEKILDTNLAQKVIRTLAARL